jgi:hypothetical protein
MTDAKLLTLTSADAREWIFQSLSSGHEISKTVAESLASRPGTVCGIVSPSSELAPGLDFASGGMVGSEAAVQCLSKVFEVLARQGSRIVLVEDDVQRRTDPGLEAESLSSAYMGDDVVHWSDLAVGSGTVAAETVKGGAFGYPLNAFVSTRSPTELGLAEHTQVAAAAALEIANSLTAIVVSAFDAESFLVWSARGLMLD